MHQRKERLQVRIKIYRSSQSLQTSNNRQLLEREEGEVGVWEQKEIPTNSIEIATSRIFEERSKVWEAYGSAHGWVREYWEGKRKQTRSGYRHDGEKASQSHLLVEWWRWSVAVWIWKKQRQRHLSDLLSLLWFYSELHLKISLHVDWF